MTYLDTGTVSQTPLQRQHGPGELVTHGNLAVVVLRSGGSPVSLGGAVCRGTVTGSGVVVVVCRVSGSVAGSGGLGFNRLLSSTGAAETSQQGGLRLAGRSGSWAMTVKHFDFGVFD